MNSQSRAKAYILCAVVCWAVSEDESEIGVFRSDQNVEYSEFCQKKFPTELQPISIGVSRSRQNQQWSSCDWSEIRIIRSDPRIEDSDRWVKPPKSFVFNPNKWLVMSPMNDERDHLPKKKKKNHQPYNQALKLHRKTVLIITKSKVLNRAIRKRKKYVSIRL